MRNTIEYYYDIEVDDLIYKDGKYIFKKYLLVPIVREIDLNLYKYVYSFNRCNYKIVMNVDKEYVTNIKNIKYILLERINSYTLNIDNILNNSIPLGTKEIHWDKLWEEKLDYYENYLKSIPCNKLKESFVYYSGLTENAIKFYKEIKKEYHVFLSHLRLNEMDYLNPVNLIVDYRARDVAEYIKLKFFNDEVNDIDFNFIFNNLNEIDILILYARLLYPSYYYDCYEKICNGSEDKCLEIYINKIADYERLLMDLYFKIKKIINIPKIGWIIKKDLSLDKPIIRPYQMKED